MSKRVLQELRRVGEIAAVLVDGDEASRIITDDAMFHLARQDETHRFLTMDHYEVDHATFLRMKKLLLRIERLGEVGFCCSLWVPVPGTDRVTLAVQNGNVNRYYEFGQSSIVLPDPMRACIEQREIIELEPEEGCEVCTALVPILDSLEDLAAVLELSSSEGPAPEYA